jgi:hypothetical protein
MCFGTVLPPIFWKKEQTSVHKGVTRAFRHQNYAAVSASKQKRLGNIVSPLDDLWRKGKVTW